MSIRLLRRTISNPTRFFSSSLYFHPSRIPQFPMIRYLSSTVLNSLTASNSTSLDWTPPLRGPCIIESSDFRCKGSDSDNQHWSIILKTHGFEFKTEQALFHYYIRTLASVVGSEEEAKRKIYFVSCAYSFGFAAEIDEETADKLWDEPGVDWVDEDDFRESRKGLLGDKVTMRFNPVNWNHRVDDILSYHHLSERSLAWNSNHWLVYIQYLDGGLCTKQHVVNFCIQMLADVVGSEDEAMEKIYSVWCKMPFGFGAKIDEKTLNRIKALPDVLLVLPDFAFDVIRKSKVLIIFPSSHLVPSFHLKSDPVYYNYQTSQVLSHEDYEDRLEKPLGKSVQSLACLTLTNDHQRLDNLFSYYHLSERNSEWNYDHWLIVINQHEGGFQMETQILDFMIKILAEAIGSKKEAKEKIYIIWSSIPLGFGAEIDEETSNKLKRHPSVLKVLPDYGFDVKDKVPGALSICNSQKSSFEYYYQGGMKTIYSADGDTSNPTTCIQVPPSMPSDSN